MKGKNIVLALTVLIAVSLILLGLLQPQKMRPEKLQDHLDSLAQGQGHIDESGFIEDQARALAECLFDSSRNQEEFAEELTTWYIQAKDVDVLLVYNPGGFGAGPLSQDPEWPSVMYGIQEYLEEQWGYTSVIVEHTRADYAGLGFLKAADDIRNEYSSTAPILAAKMGFLSKYVPGLRIIITGRSFGAVFANEVIGLLPTNDRVFSVQAGRSPSYTPTSESDNRTLLIENNGTGADAWSDGDLWTIIQANLGHVPSSSPPEEGSMQILKWYLRVPGHAYTWVLPGVQDEVIEFLDERFAGEQE